MPRVFASGLSLALSTSQLPTSSYSHFADIVESEIGLVGVAVEIAGLGDAGEDQDGVDFGFDAGNDVGVHAVADNGCFFATALQDFQGVTHDERIGFADIIGLAAGGQLDGGQQSPAGGDDAVLGRAGQIGIGADKAGAVEDEVRSLDDFVIGVGRRFTDDDIIGIGVVDGDAGFFQGLEQAGIADDKSRAAGMLGRDKTGGGNGGGDKMILTDIDAEPGQPVAQVGRALGRGVGQKNIVFSRCLQPVNEGFRPVEQMGTVINHAVHIADETAFGPDGINVDGHVRCLSFFSHPDAGMAE